MRWMVSRAPAPRACRIPQEIRRRLSHRKPGSTGLRTTEFGPT
jgi:hypothetical protein